MNTRKVPLEDYKPVTLGARNSHDEPGVLGGNLPDWAPQMPLKVRLIIVVCTVALLLYNRPLGRLIGFFLGLTFVVAFLIKFIRNHS